MTNLTDPKEIFNREQDGLTIRQEQFGVKYPNGYIYWYPVGSGDLTTPGKRGEFKHSWEMTLKNANVPLADLVFLKRVATRKYDNAEQIKD